MNNPLFASSIRNLLHINVITDVQNEECVRRFEDSFCYNARLQPMFLAKNLSHLITDIQDGILYEFRDAIGICLLLMRIEEEPVLIGPFVRREFDAARVHRVMISRGLSASYEDLLRLYYSSFPLCSVSHAIDTVLAMVKTFWPEKEEFRLARIDDYPEKHKLPKEASSEILDYSILYRRYDLENQFLSCIERGDTENVMTAYRQIGTAGITENRYTNAIYQNPSVGFAMLRVLVRKAAESGGASIIEVNEITQRALQLAMAEPNYTKKMQIIQNMIMELTEAVDQARSRLRDYSTPIRKVVEILRHSYAQELTLPYLASQVNLSPSQLSRRFSKETGMSITQYIAATRCEEAALLLADSEISIQQIAAYVGYMDNNYFVKVFKRQYGMTPSEYRKKNAGKKA